MNRSEFAVELAKDLGLEKQEAISLIDIVFERLIKEVLTEGKVTLSNFGAFELKTRKPTVRKNPNTGEPVVVPERYNITFKTSRAVKVRVNERINKAKGVNA